MSNSAIWRSIALDIEFQLSVKNQQIFMNDIAIPKMLSSNSVEYKRYMALDSAIDIEFQLSVKNQQIFMNDIAIPIKCYRQIVSNSAIWRSIALRYRLSNFNYQ